MSDYQIFSNYVPLADAGEMLTLTPTQPLREDEGDAEDYLQLEGPTEVKLKVQGPQLQLTPADIAGVYPAPGSEESPDEFLPHIALERRTLPWERVGPGGQKPWLALLLLTESELRGADAGTVSPAATLESVKLSQVAARDPAGYDQLRNVVGLSDDTPLNVVYLKNSTWWARRPRKADLKYMCHMRRDLSTGKDRSIVMSYRLPYAGAQGDGPELHTALLISLEKRDDLYDPSRAPGLANEDGFQVEQPGEAVLVVLHHWTFRPSTGGDFEQVIRSIAIQPNGGVLRFGNLPKPVATGDSAPLSGGFQGLLNTDGYFLEPLPHTFAPAPGEQERGVTWRSPLRPFATPPRSLGFAVRAAPEEFENPEDDDPLDYSHATAFELGRLLAFARPDILEDLRGIRPKAPPIEPQIAINEMPTALQKPDWVSNPAWAWEEDTWSFKGESLVKGEEQFFEMGVADVNGIAEQVEVWLADVVKDLEVLDVPVSQPVSQIPVATINTQELGMTFSDVEMLGKT